MRRPSGEVLLLNLLLLPFLFWGLHASDTDTFYHLASGRWMFENGRILDRETFSFSAPGRSWLNCYWLFQLILYGSFELGGYAGVLVLRASLLLATANLLLAWIRARAGGSRLETLAFSLLAFSFYLPRALNVRGQIFSYLFLIVMLWRLERFSRGSRRFDPVLPVLCVLWANIHGVAYPIALSTIVIFAVAALFPHRNRMVADVLRDPSLTRWVVQLAACTLAFAVNPFGPSLLGTVLLAGREEALSQIAEMSPFSPRQFLYLTPDLDIWSMAIFNWTLLVGLSLLAFWISRRDVLALSAFALGVGLAIYKARFVTEFMILAVPFMAAAVAELRVAGVTRSRRMGHVLTGVSAYLVLALLAKLGPAIVSQDAFAFVDGRIHPVGPARLMEEQNLRGALFCNPTSAGYVTWALHPSRVRVYMDMRAPILFNAQEIWLYKAVGDTVGLDVFIRRYPVDFFLLARHVPLEAALRAGHSGFAPVWVDPRFVLFVREAILDERRDLRLHTLDAMYRVESGFPLRAEDEPRRVETEATRLAATWPENHLAQASVVSAELALGRAADALVRARSLADRHPHAAAYRYFEGLALEGLGRTGEAAKAFASAQRREPEFLPPYPALAGLLARGGNTEAALGVMEEYSRRQRFRLSARDHLLIASLRHRRRAVAAAADAYERALWQLREDDPLREEALCGLGDVRVDSGQAEEALALLEGRPSPAASLVRARALRALGRLAEARETLLRLTSHPDVAPALREMARAELARGTKPVPSR